MRKYVYIAIGGFAGAVLRDWVRSVDFAAIQESFPIHTLLINLLGSFLLALLVTLAAAPREISPPVLLGLSAGFLGAFTTFSAFCREIAAFAGQGAFALAAAYAALSLLLGLAAAWAGWRLAVRILRRSGRRPEAGAAAIADRESGESA